MKDLIIRVQLIIYTYYQFVSGLKISVYYESLCYDSQKFIQNELIKAYQTFGDYLTIDLVPFGNVKEYKDGNGYVKYDCQHGVQECRANKIQACVVNDFWWSGTSQARERILEFISCMFDSDLITHNAIGAGQKCASHLPVHSSYILECVSGDRGHQIIDYMGRRTHSLSPRHTYIPWITVENEFDWNSQNLAESDLIEMICRKSNPRPIRCSQRNPRILG